MKATLKLKVILKPKAALKPKAIIQAKGNKDNIREIEKRLKKLRKFKLTSAFKRKAGVILNTEKKRLVDINNKKLLNNKNIIKPIKESKKRKRLIVID